MMIRDGWSLVVSPSALLDAERQWSSWVAAQAESVDADDVRIDTGRGTSGEWRRYWVRREMPMKDADRVVVATGASFDHRRRKNNTLLGSCDDPNAIAQLVEALPTTSDERPFLMMMGNPTIVFLRGRTEVLAAISVKDGLWLSCHELWCGDARLESPDRLATWMSDELGLVVQDRGGGFVRRDETNGSGPSGPDESQALGD